MMKRNILLCSIVVLGTNPLIESTLAFTTPYLTTPSRQHFNCNQNHPNPASTRLFFYNNNNGSQNKHRNVVKKKTKKATLKKSAQSSVEREQPTKIKPKSDTIKGTVSKLPEDVNTQTEEQTQAMEEILAQARELIAESPEVQKELGNTLIINDPTREAPHTTSVNGEKKDYVQVTFDVMSSGGMGSVGLIAVDGVIKKLRLSMKSGRKIIDLVNGKSGNNSDKQGRYRNPYPGRSYKTEERTVFKTNPISRNDFIDVEIIDVDFSDLKP